MTTTPQAVTERYVSNLLRNGENRNFRILTIETDFSEVDGINVGCFYRCVIHNPHARPFEDQQPKKTAACGITPSQAIHRALEKHGVTFR